MTNKFQNYSTGNRMQRRSVTFCFVLVRFRSVSFRLARYQAQSPSATFFAEETQARWSTFPAALSCSRPPHDKERPWDAYFKSGRSPRSLIAHVFDGTVKAHKRN